MYLMFVQESSINVMAARITAPTQTLLAHLNLVENGEKIRRRSTDLSLSLAFMPLVAFKPFSLSLCPFAVNPLPLSERCGLWMWDKFVLFTEP